MGFPVAEITDFRLASPEAPELFGALEEWLDARGAVLVSARLPMDRLAESFALEEQGFRFIETVLHPRLDDLGPCALPDEEIFITDADASELEEIASLAESCFGTERFHVDPRLDKAKADKRYGNWVRGIPDQNTQVLWKIEYEQKLAGFFIFQVDDGHCHWHLTAMAPHIQGRGIGRRSWRAVLNAHLQNNVRSVSTTIAARNVRVLNLYSSLNFRFDPPEMTFHWLRA